MCQSHCLSPTSLCGLVGESLPLGPSAAGQGTFPTLHSRIFHWMPRPLPRWLQRCTCPFLPSGLRPYPEFTAGRRRANVRAATSARGRISGLQTFLYVKASSFACHPGRSHRCSAVLAHPCSRFRKRVTIFALSICEVGSHFLPGSFRVWPYTTRQPWRVLRAEYGSLPHHTSDMLVARIGQLATGDFHPIRLAACRLLRKPPFLTCSFLSTLICVRLTSHKVSINSFSRSSS
jgi:hypothetical protein